MALTHPDPMKALIRMHSVNRTKNDSFRSHSTEHTRSSRNAIDQQLKPDASQVQL